MGVYSVVISLFLGLIIILHELIRQRSKKVDILLGVNIIYLLTFAFVPIVTQLSLFGFSHDRAINLDDVSYLIGSTYSLLGYIIIIASYYAFKKKYPLKKFIKDENIKGKKEYIVLALIISIFGVFCTILYTYSLGGVLNVLESGTLYRSSASDGSQYAFIRNLALFTLTGSFLFFGLAINEKNKTHKVIFVAIFLFLFMTSLYLLFNRAGRLGLVSYLVMFPTGLAIYNNKIKLKSLVFGLILATFFILHGKRIFNYFVLDDFSLEDDDEGIFHSIVGEFGFPFINIANAINIPFVNELPRLFIDVPIGIYNLLPSRLLGINSSKTITEYNSEYTGGPIPVDIITFGYFSFGLAGIIIVCLVFGYLIRIFEYTFSGHMNILFVMFYVTWIEFFAFRVMYADLYNVLKGDIHIIVSTIGLIIVYKYIKRKSNAQAIRPSIR